MGREGKILSCTRGEEDEDQRPVSPPLKTPKSQQKLIRVGSKLYGRNTHTERKFNIDFRVEKAPGGVAFRTQNELLVDKQQEYKLLEGRLPAYPGEEALRPPTPIPEEEEDEARGGC